MHKTKITIRKLSSNDSLSIYFVHVKNKAKLNKCVVHHLDCLKLCRSFKPNQVFNIFKWETTL